ncbi:MAG: PhzF family phenazine biosynthesis protein, partial [Phycisphaeraceae bacterium]
MSTPIYIVDAFTEVPFAGNPAAVCLLLEEADAAWMQRVAMEMNLSETAFVRPITGGFELRWFTPAAEVELCGHATLATAHLLWSRNLTQATEMIYFQTKYVDGITCTREATGMIGMDLPIDVPRDEAPPEELIETLGVEAVNVARGRY